MADLSLAQYQEAEHRVGAGLVVLVGGEGESSLGQPEEIAAMITFLASNDASFATRAEFVVDGGYTAG